MLYASWLFQRIVPPVLSFALGSLGFLTKFDFDEYRTTLTRAFRDGVSISLRLRFECTIMRSQHRGSTRRNSGSDGTLVEAQEDLVSELLGEESDDEHTHRPECSHDILNDVVVDRGPNASMCTFFILRAPSGVSLCWKPTD